MANISFANLSQAFSIIDHTYPAYTSTQASGPNNFNYNTLGGHQINVTGSALGFGVSPVVPVTGVINGFGFDLGDDGLGFPEISVSGLSVQAADFGFGTGSPAAQRDAFWKAALGAADNFSFTLAAYTSTLEFSGDGAQVSDGNAHTGANDTMSGGAQALGGGSVITGDYFDILSGSAVGGADQITVGALQVFGDFHDISAGRTGDGGNDTIAPNSLGANLPSIFAAAGDGNFISGTLNGGNDVIDLRLTDITGYGSAMMRLTGDAQTIGVGGILNGGDDTIYGSAIGDDIFGDERNSSGTVVGGDDVLYGMGGDDYIVGGGGDDTLDGGVGNDTLDGLDGNDTASYASALSALTMSTSTVVLVGSDVDVLYDIENIVGTAFGDYILGNNAANRYEGQDGDDHIAGELGADTLLGGNGADTLLGETGSDVLDGGAGIDTADYSTSTAAVTLSLVAGTGVVGAETDTLIDIENVVGSAFNDTITGDSIANRLEGGDGGDRLAGDLGADTLRGDAGADTLIGGAGADALDGGAGADTADYSLSGAAVTIKLWAGAGVGGDAQGDVLSKTENLIGSAFNDRLIGLFNQNNVFYGGDGADYFDGFAGVDSIYGENGDDRIIGGAGGDLIDGGAGHDLASFGSSQAAINVNLTTLVVSGGDAAGDTLVGIEGVIGSAYADTLTGNASYNTLQANGGADYVDGGAGFDFINGHNGADTLIGGTGNDTLIGGLHDDRFVFRTGDGADRINDFGVGGATGSDVIELQGYGAAFDSFAEVMAVASQQGADTLINFGGGNSILLVGINMASLNSADFLFS